MRFAALLLAVAVLGCTPNSTDKSKSQPAASAQIGAVTNDPNMVELRIKIPKSALPRDIVVPQSASGQKDVSKLSPDDVAKLSEFLRTSASTETLGPGCHRSCGWECTDVGGGTGRVCYRTCEVNCPD